MRVSVLIPAYNHGRYLRQAIEGALMQETDFPFEILVGDDRSTDDTLAVAQRYQGDNPDRVRVLASERNVGGHENTRRLCAASQAPLIAFCEGDDFWTDPHKLARQAAVFAARPEVSICFHAAMVLDDRSGRSVRKIGTGRTARDYTLAEVIGGGGGMMPTMSIMLRRTALHPFDDWVLQSPVGDYPLALWAASRGTAHSLPEAMATYRVGIAGSWTATIGADIARDWQHTMAAIAMLDAFPSRAARPDAAPAVQRMVRRYLRDLCAQHGVNAVQQLAGFASYRSRLTLADRLFLFGFDDPQRFRMKATWFAISSWRSLARLLGSGQ